ncbi:cupin domain-containing protein [Timonella senegalensis]|uniref:cupin domain-containing protein n=1 Tax=Timonella senegalensis TaxID=1465825 RepID=UPI000306B2FE|nr:cupin domain-containing protein [Timonella senegalensis]
MIKKHLDEIEYRFGTYGPGYSIRGPRTDLGVCQLHPGDDAVNHYHAAIEETFVVLEGEATLWVDGRESYTCTKGDVFQMEPGEQHYFVNNSDSVFRALFIKAPYDPNDGVQVPWTPGEPLPELAPGR